MTTPVAIALGSNLGDRQAHLAFAAARLAAMLQNLRQSSWYDTTPVGVVDQPRFLNGAVVGKTMLPPRALLEELFAIERQQGRERPFTGAPRTLDLDLVLYGTLQVDAPDLVLPHPRFRERLFVLEPLAELAPDWIDPVSGETISALLQRAQARRV